MEEFNTSQSSNTQETNKPDNKETMTDVSVWYTSGDVIITDDDGEF
jgi:hypothetical protein